MCARETADRGQLGRMRGFTAFASSGGGSQELAVTVAVADDGAGPMSVTPPCHAARMLTIDCDQCVMRNTGACDDCVVSFVVDREPGEALVIDVEEERAVRMLARAGLVPRLRHVAG